MVRFFIDPFLAIFSTIVNRIRTIPDFSEKRKGGDVERELVYALVVYYITFALFHFVWNEKREDPETA